MSQQKNLISLLGIGYSCKIVQCLDFSIQIIVGLHGNGSTMLSICCQ